MSGKLFVQVVALMIIGILLLVSAKFGMKCLYKSKWCNKPVVCASCDKKM